MFRESTGKGFIVMKKDLANGLVKKQAYLKYIEHWVYKFNPVKSNIVLSPAMRKKLEQENGTYLHCIIISSENRECFVEEGDKIYIKGVRFDGEDIDKYLRKTKRSR